LSGEILSWGTDPTSEPPLALGRAVYELRREESLAVADLREGQLEGIAAGTLKAYVARVSPIKVPPEWSELLDVRQLWLFELQHDRLGAVWCVVDRLPQLWQTHKLGSIKEYVELKGVLCGRTGQRPVFLTQTWSWFPEESSENVPDDWIWLAKQGVNIADIARLTEKMQKPLVADETQVFYDLLGLSHLEKVEDGPIANIEPFQLLKSPLVWVGRGVSFRISSARVIRVAISEPRIAARLKQNHYWQIDGFLALSHPVEVAIPGGKPVLFRSRFPVNVVSLDLSPELKKKVVGASPSANGPFVARVSLPLWMEGTFLRLWSYESDFLRQQGGNEQIAPLLIARSLEDVDQSLIQRDLEKASWVLMTLLALPIVLVVVSLGYLSKMGRKSLRRVNKRLEFDPQIFDDPVIPNSRET
jgi:hypothetical protein